MKRNSRKHFKKSQAATGEGGGRSGIGRFGPCSADDFATMRKKKQERNYLRSKLTRLGKPVASRTENIKSLYQKIRGKTKRGRGGKGRTSRWQKAVHCTDRRATRTMPPARTGHLSAGTDKQVKRLQKGSLSKGGQAPLLTHRLRSFRCWKWNLGSGSPHLFYRRNFDPKSRRERIREKEKNAMSDQETHEPGQKLEREKLG